GCNAAIHHHSSLALLFTAVIAAEVVAAGGMRSRQAAAADALVAAPVAPGFDRREGMPGQHGPHRRRLLVTMLEQQPAARAQVIPCLLRDSCESRQSMLLRHQRAA